MLQHVATRSQRRLVWEKKQDKDKGITASSTDLEDSDKEHELLETQECPSVGSNRRMAKKEKIKGPIDIL